MRLVIDRLGYTLGDVNGDGITSISDVTLMIDYILSSGDLPIYFNKLAADYNMDGLINISDISALIDAMLQ